MSLTVSEAISTLPAEKARVFKQAFDGQGRDNSMSLSDYLSTVNACTGPWMSAFPADWNSEKTYSKVRTAMSAMMQQHPECVPADLESTLRESFKSKNIQKILGHRRRTHDPAAENVGVSNDLDGDEGESDDESCDSLGDRSGDDEPEVVDMERIVVIRVRDACLRWANQHRSDIHGMLASLWGPSPAGDLRLESVQQMLRIFRMVVNGAPVVNVLEFITQRYCVGDIPP